MNKRIPRQLLAKKRIAPRSFKIYLKPILRALIICCVIAALIGAYTYTKPSNFPIKNVKVVASYAHVDQALLQNTIVPFTKNGFFYINVWGLQRELLKVPWVYTVSVERSWPDTLIVNVVEQTPVASWGKKALINGEGAIFSADAETFPKDLPILYGPDDQEPDIFNIYRQMQTILAPHNFSIVQLNLTPHAYWCLILNTKTTIYIPKSDPAERLTAFLQLYPKIQANHSGSPASIDLRYRNGLAVKWSNESS